MQQARKHTIAVIGVFFALVIVATTVGYFLALDGTSVIGSAFTGAFVSVSLLVVYGGCYQLWARVAWDAPFLVGDTVKIARGPHTGADGTVISLGQGVEVEVEFHSRGLVRYAK